MASVNIKKNCKIIKDDGIDWELVDDFKNSLEDLKKGKYIEC